MPLLLIIFLVVFFAVCTVGTLCLLMLRMEGVSISLSSFLIFCAATSLVYVVMFIVCYSTLGIPLS